jgi:anti-sigma regulatory factor (Ser/Thr protein kinase)
MARRQDPDIRSFILHNVESYPSSIASVAAKKFGLSRAGISRYVTRLVADGLLEARGNTKARAYSLKASVEQSFQRERNGRWTEDNVWREDIRPLMSNVKDNIIDICQYGVTEIVNNVLDHSRSQDVVIDYTQTFDSIRIAIYDRGIGIFSKIQEDFKFDDARTALLELSKGRLTSDRRNHSGEGIYFTSRMFDRFSIWSGYLFYSRTKDQDDWLVKSHDKDEHMVGTFVTMTIKLSAEWTMKDVFNKYQGDDIHFRTTHIPIVLGKYPGEQLVSRSQAKRILARVTDFAEVLLDFRGVVEIGQAFADEIFRVFQKARPDTRIIAFNTNEDIGKMIEYVQIEKTNVSVPGSSKGRPSVE